MDALQALRQACIQGRVPTLTPEDTTVDLGDRGSPWPLDTRTSWRSVSREFYTLHALILLLQFADKPIGDYLRTVTTWKVKFVSNVDRRELLAYLKGEIDTSDAIQSSAVADKSVFAAQDSMPIKRQRAGEGDAGGLTEDQLRDAKQRHAERLGGPARARALIISDRMAGESELLEGMSSDKLLELRTKRLAQKRSTLSLGAGGELGEEEAAVDPAFLDADRQTVAHIRAMDALQALRQACLQGRVPTMTPEDTTVDLGDRGSPWSLDTRTSWRSKSNEFYTLHALILLLQFADTPIGDYLKTVITWKVKFVSNVDRKELLAYLKGEIDTSDAIRSDKSDTS
eukprot:TRINITY_DN16161_c0_g1_i4.p1 TRINITY_DN16161_c0_g1~~TRINITY_DN16161_c0_g1_i4.p1  ORF type:complete len:342 (-),score=81.11 TRINITY_DN16161_c0_g1_i4:17-1042(-)